MLKLAQIGTSVGLFDISFQNILTRRANLGLIGPKLVLIPGTDSDEEKSTIESNYTHFILSVPDLSHFVPL